MNEDALRERLHDLAPRPGEVDPTAIDPAAIIRSGRHRRRGRLAAVGVAAAVVASGIAVPLYVTGTSSTTTYLSVAGGLPGIPTAGELTVDGMLARACGGIAPLSVLTAPGGAENAGTPEAAALRRVIAQDPSTGYAPPSPHNWVLVAEHGGTVTFAQRTGAVGFDAVIVIRKNKNGGYSYDRYGTGGCGPLGYADGSSVKNLGEYTVAGDVLTIHYVGGTYPPGTCNSGPPTMHVFEHPTTVDLLAVLPPSKDSSTGCNLVGQLKTITVHLTAPLANRTVRGIGFVPPQVLKPGTSPFPP